MSTLLLLQFLVPSRDSADKFRHPYRQDPLLTVAQGSFYTFEYSFNQCLADILCPVSRVLKALVRKYCKLLSIYLYSPSDCIIVIVI